MYLFPTEEEMKRLYRQINPTIRIMDFLYSRPPAEGSMAEHFLESEDIELVMEDDAMPFDDIEDDIISMRCDVNGFRLHISAPKYLDKPNPGDCPVNFKGWTYEYINRDTEQDIEMLKTLPNSQFVDSWDDI